MRKQFPCLLLTSQAAASAFICLSFPVSFTRCLSSHYFHWYYSGLHITFIFSKIKSINQHKTAWKLCTLSEEKKRCCFFPLQLNCRRQLPALSAHKQISLHFQQGNLLRVYSGSENNMSINVVKNNFFCCGPWKSYNNQHQTLQ